MRFVIFSIFFLSITGVWTLPLNPEVVEGIVEFSSSAQQLVVQVSDRAIIRWKQFSIDPDESVVFCSTGKVLNEVVGEMPSRLSGTLEASSELVLTNPKGIINRGSCKGTSFVFSTLENEEKTDRFIENNLAAVVNIGSIEASKVAIAGFEVHNLGTILSQAAFLIGAREVKFLEPIPEIRSLFGIDGSQMYRFDQLPLLGMPGSTVVQAGVIASDFLLIYGDYLDVQPGSQTEAKTIFLGEHLPAMQNNRAILIRESVLGDDISICSKGIVGGIKKIKGRLDLSAPALLGD